MLDTSQSSIRIAFIGAGNMARSLIHGISQHYPAIHLSVTDPNQAQLDYIQTHWQTVQTSTDNDVIARQANVIVLAVKPQIMQGVVESLSTAIAPDCMIISVAAGITVNKLQQWIDSPTAIVRCMPNTPALVQSGASGLYANKLTTESQRQLANDLLAAVGIVRWFEQESALDTVTAVSGSGPAYFFLVMEAMQQAAEQMGMSAEDAKQLTLQTAYGAAKLALESDESAKTLRQRVMSKGGTTEAAINTLIDGGLPDLFATALQAAEQRAKTLSQ